MKQTSILITGSSCSGKSSVLKKIKSKYPHAGVVAIGDLLRETAKTDLFVAECIKKGAGVPDEIIVDIYNKNMPKDKELLLIDAEVRTTRQMNAARNAPNLSVIYLEISAQEAINRAKSRNRSDHDNIKKRLQFFEENTIFCIRELEKLYSKKFFVFNTQKDAPECLDAILCKIVES